jgi:hypothetical protein
MKLSNLFKKESKNLSKSTTEALTKSQLEKVVGGGSDAIVTTTAAAADVQKGKKGLNAVNVKLA